MTMFECKLRSSYIFTNAPVLAYEHITWLNMVVIRIVGLTLSIMGLKLHKGSPIKYVLAKTEFLDIPPR